MIKFMPSFSTILLAATTTTTALMAGLFYAYSCSVVPGLGRLPDTGYIAAMQSINRCIQNPVFFMGFMGALLLLPLSTYLQYGTGRFYFLLAATIVYAAGVFGVTAAGNVPLNNALDAFNVHTASADEIARQRARFEDYWNPLNTVRTLASVLTVVLVITACLVPPKTMAVKTPVTIKTSLLAGFLFFVSTHLTTARPPAHRQSPAVTVSMKGMRFYPKTIEIPAGTTVEWVNESDGWHNVVLQDGSFSSSLVKKGETIRYTFSKSGTYRYYCQPHRIMGMKGVVVVK